MTKAASRLAHEARVRSALDAIFARGDLQERSAIDPVEFVRRYDKLLDREIVAVIASSLAFGNVMAFRPKIESVLRVLGDSPAHAADDEKKTAAGLRTWKHRLYTGADVVCLIRGARAVQKKEGSIGAFVERLFHQSTGDMLETASGLVQAIRACGLDQRTTRGAKHILVDPKDGSAAKRVMLLFRWMARADDGVDVGVWKIPSSALMMPVDTHIHRLSKNLGFTKRNAASWATAVEITEVLRRFDPQDPVRYDFSLCHMGMVQRCPSTKDPVRCEGCGVKPVCLHWKETRAKS